MGLFSAPTPPPVPPPPPLPPAANPSTMASGAVQAAGAAARSRAAAIAGSGFGGTDLTPAGSLAAAPPTAKATALGATNQ